MKAHLATQRAKIDTPRGTKVFILDSVESRKDRNDVRACYRSQWQSSLPCIKPIVDSPGLTTQNNIKKLQETFTQRLQQLEVGRVAESQDESSSWAGGFSSEDVSDCDESDHPPSPHCDRKLQVSFVMPIYPHVSNVAVKEWITHGIPPTIEKRVRTRALYYRLSGSKLSDEQNYFEALRTEMALGTCAMER